MRCLPYLLIGGILFGACGKTVFKSHEGQFCSSNPGDDPFYECTRMFDFVCINTYSVPIQGAGPNDMAEQPLWLCRLACNEKTSCPVAGDVCCQGAIYGFDYGVTSACVPRDQCNSLAPPDAGPRREAGVEDGGQGDAGVGDAGVGDAPTTLDGPADTPAADAGAVDVGPAVDADVDAT